MDPDASEVARDFRPFFRVYKDGRVEKYKLFDQVKPVPAGLDPATGVETKDVVVSPETGVSARIFFARKASGPDRKLPLLVHYHGGGFCAGSPFDTASHGLLSTMVTRAGVVAISIGYRLAPENPLPIAYEDSFEALKWIAGHSGGSGPEPWLNQYADLGRVFIVGESAGANIGHYVAVRAGAAGLAGIRIKGMLIVHPFFGGKETDEMYKFMCPTSSGLDDDLKLNPAVDPDLPKMACEKVLVCVAEKDWLRGRGVKYYDTLCGSEWKGKAELVEAKDEGHCFHLFSKNERAEQLIKKMVDFITED
ncbi:probable carboxylesterase 2 [Rhodamnia argentea]|uniref:Probable carboxylesterase 2 n=1 Tax=Rhodamnia argentea TaxID=178133 RepID=A0A8B8NR79_9MYRT|nr:probable carboxylesterase 2 [Rhodamnia argentea]